MRKQYNIYHITLHSVTYVTLFETHTNPNLETSHIALVEISLVSSSICRICDMSYVFRLFREMDFPNSLGFI